MSNAVAELGPQGIPARLRQAKGELSLEGIARAAKVDRSTIFRLASGRFKAAPDTATLWEIAKACGVRGGWLAFGEEPMR